MVQVGRHPVVHVHCHSVVQFRVLDKPRLNCWFGAVALVQTHNQEPVLIRRCAVVANPHAYEPLPLDVMDGLRGVDRSTTFETLYP